LPVAIGKSTSMTTLQLYNESAVDPSASVIENFRSPETVRYKLNIPMFRFSDIEFEDSFKIGILKIDVEGAELEVLESLIERIKADSPLIFIEILPVYNRKNSTRIIRQKKIQELLYTNNYSIFRVLKQRNKYLGIKHITEFEIHSDLNQCDYILIPTNMSGQIKKVLSRETE
jgi:hypothetical protein